MKNVLYVKLLVFMCIVSGVFFPCGAVFAEYDIVLRGVNRFPGTVSYTSQSIHIAEGGFAEYENLVLDNCIVDVNGFVEINSFLDMNDSVFYVYGDLLIEPGAGIYETGDSCIVAKGNALRSGQISLKGGPYDPITVDSDYSLTEFIIIEEDSSANSVLQNIDFYGGWCNIQIYNNRLNEAIRNCRFISSDYAVYQESTDKVTDVRFCFFCWNIISVYAR